RILRGSPDPPPATNSPQMGNQFRALFDQPVLMDAVQMQRRDIAALLLDHGADPNHGGEFLWTPLTCAAEHGDLPCLQLLLEHGANVRTKGPWDQLPMIAAVTEGHQPAAAGNRRVRCVELLLAYGADVDTRDDQDRTALMNAAGQWFREGD